ncbi:MAG: tyrosine-type recombinase/integrase [Opitutaceae bacterium]
MAAVVKASMLSRAKRYLAHRRKMGFALAIEGELLIDFARFADRAAPQPPLTTSLVLRWATRPPTGSQTYHAMRYAIVRGFARYCAALDPRIEIPPARFLGSVFKRRAPHIFSSAEIRLLLRQAKALSPRVSPLRPLTYATLLALAACTGLRRCELIRLGVDDLDVSAGCLRVPPSKFSPPRVLPLHPTTVRALQRYRAVRLRTYPLTDRFFAGQKGRPLQGVSIDWTLRQLAHAITPNGDRTSIRFVDLRHSFTTHRIAQWSQQKQPVAHHLLLLARYLGHQNFRSTWWYVSREPAALGAAAARFQDYFAGRKKPPV